MNFVKELEWRGMINNMMPGTEEQLEKELTSAYLGIDPTADSLHIGHLVGVMMLRHLQRSGHRPIALIGGATGMIGDPSMKSQERVLIDEETLRHNQECIKAQLAKFLDFDSDAPNAAVLVNNYDWMKGYGFLNFIRDIGKHITVNYMMAKDSVKKRLAANADHGMSFTEELCFLGVNCTECCCSNHRKERNSFLNLYHIDFYFSYFLTFSFIACILK